MLDWSMDVKEGLELAEQLVDRSLKPIEIDIFEESWKGREGKKYREIAETYPCTVGNVNDAASDLWKLLSKALGKKVIKSNFRRELEKRSRSHSAQVPQPQEPAQEETPSKNPDFVGREEAIAGFTPDLNELVQDVRSKRKHRIQEQCGKMKLLNISQRVETDHLYVDVNVLQDIPSQRYTDISQLARGFDPAANDFDRFYLGRVPYKRVPGLEVIEDRCKVMVLGKPGSGKSTFLQYVAIECDRGRLQPDRVPIFIRLSRFAEDVRDEGSLTLLDYINQEFCNCSIDYPQVAENLLKPGKCLILLDGLDEVPGTYSREVVRRIRQFCDRYYNNSLVITCRTNARNYCFQSLGFIEVEVADFKDAQIKKFAEKWFTAVTGNKPKLGEVIANEFLKKLRLPENKRIRDLAVTPILLHLTCLFFRDRNGNFPNSRAELYQEGLNILLSKWDESRGIQRDEVYGKLSPEDKKDLLIYVAANLFKQNDYFPNQYKLQQMIAAYLKLPENQGGVVLKSIEEQHGLLVERAQDIYSFSHLTFQEYLTARAIIKSSEALSDLQSWVSHLSGKRWREVFSLVGELSHLLQGADKFMLLMKEHIDGLVTQSTELQNFLFWVNQKALSISGTYKQVAVRALYFTFEHELRLEPDRDCLRILDSNFAHTCANVLELARAIDLNPSDILTLKKDRDLALDIALNHILYHARYLMTIANSTFASRRSCVFGVYRALDFALMLDDKLQQDLQHLKAQLPQREKEGNNLFYWWQSNGQAWIKQLIDLMNRHLNIAHDWFKSSVEENELISGNEDKLKFSHEGDDIALYNEDDILFNKGLDDILLGLENHMPLDNLMQERILLGQYYEANKLLIHCLDSASHVTPKVRLQIENGLFAPIAEIKEKRLGD